MSQNKIDITSSQGKKVHSECTEENYIQQMICNLLLKLNYFFFKNYKFSLDFNNFIEYNKSIFINFNEIVKDK